MRTNETLRRYAGCAAFAVIALGSIAAAQIGPPGGSGCTTTCTMNSLALGGATIGSNALAVTGSANISTSISFGSASFVSGGGVGLGLNAAGDFVATATGGYTWGSASVNSPDTKLSRNAAGVVQVGTTASNSLGTLLANTLRTNGFTVATLPTGVTGARAYVTDQLTACAATGVALTGGGAVTCPAFYNGSAWVGG